MNGITVSMALVDFLPVVMFFISSIILMKDLYDRMYKGQYSLLAAGSIMMFIGGFYKALWKILYAMNVCDYDKLNQSFFPCQGPGAILIFMALGAMIVSMKKGQKKGVTLSSVAAVPVAYNSTIPFIAMQVIGVGGVQWALFVIAKKLKKPFVCVLFVISFIFMLGMGYLGAKFDDSSNMHWLAQVTNIISQGALMWGIIILHKDRFAGVPVVNSKK